MTEFRLRSGSIVYSGPGVTIASNEYDTPDGGTMTREYVRCHPGSVVVLPYTGTHIVLLRQFRAPVGEVVYELPAGKRDVAGEDPAETARRECVEEAGLLPGRLELLHVFYNSPGYSDEQSWLYLAEDLTAVPSDPQGPEEQAAEVVELDLDEALELVAAGTIKDAKTIIALYAVRGRWR
ncbi:MAG: NUDIX hydrolase [Acidimicrobiia bacterium]|nr:NUDIX hydrolase [Acidimicrobiia bacterium]MBT8217353.1 NUDIX hydrolase [Acidimicrobiia bacterium]NNF10191.1 NUDIX hydrolase [Acidimicrobiia bacterium]NNL69087.1 NUDIX hydrolase [Acidimicrobiia bacterium]